MTKTVALISLLIISIFVGLGNFWFTYGIWPKSWSSLALFGCLSIIINLTLQAVLREEK